MILFKNAPVVVLHGLATIDGWEMSNLELHRRQLAKATNLQLVNHGFVICTSINLSEISYFSCYCKLFSNKGALFQQV